MKGILLDDCGVIQANAAYRYNCHYPQPGWAEQNTEDWLDGLKYLVLELTRQAVITSEDIGTIGFACQVDGVIPVDRSGRALRPAILWLDRRSQRQCERLGERISAEHIFELTGLNLDPSHVAPKIMWLYDEESHITHTADAMLVPGSFMVNILTGRKTIDASNASSTMLYDVQAQGWSHHMAEATGIDLSLLGELLPSHHVAGYVTTLAAVEFGLSTKTKVIVGCGDEHGACLGAGLITPGMICDITGTAEAIAATSDIALFDPLRLVETHVHADSRWWLIENPGFVSGGSVLWASRTIAGNESTFTTELAERAPAGSDGVIFLPCLSGAQTPTWNANAKGVYYGLAMSHGPEHMVRAVYEGCTFGFRDIINRFEAMGIVSAEIRVVSGGAKSSFWCQMKADVSGKLIRKIKQEEATALGATMLASIAEGTFRDIEAAALSLVELGEVYEPRTNLKSIYDERYGQYRRLYAALEPLFVPRIN